MKRFVPLTLLLLILSGCASIPAAGPIEIIENVNTQANLNDVRVIAKAPSPKMTGLQIVSGFISANISTINDFSLARQYLTSETAHSWKPESTVVLDSASIRFADSGSGFVTVTGLQTGLLTASHRYNIFDMPKPVNFKFSIVSRSDGLRIQGILQNGFLTTSDLIRGYSPYSLYYANEDFSSLVPEVVWLPHYEKAVGTKLINILLAGSRLGLKTAIPAGTQLQNGLVVIERGLGEVNLTSTVQMADNAQRRFMMAQIVWTLQSIPSVGRVGIFENGQTLGSRGKTVLGKNDFQSLGPDNPDRKSSLYLVHKSKISKVRNGKKSLVGYFTKAREISVTSDQLRISYATNGTLNSAYFSLPIDPDDTFSGVKSFTYDRFKRLWFIDAEGGLNCLSENGALQPLAMPLEMKLTHVSVSRDGARLAVVAKNKTGSKLFVATIVSENGNLTVGKPKTIEQSFSEVFDVDWFNSDELVVLGRIGLGKAQVQTLSLSSGYISNLNAPSAVEEIDGDGLSKVVIRKKNGQIWIYDSSGWAKFGSASAVAFSR